MNSAKPKSGPWPRYTGPEEEMVGQSMPGVWSPQDASACGGMVARSPAANRLPKWHPVFRTGKRKEQGWHRASSRR
jgi:hypothetical protein